ncbi:hypothetical protein SPFL3102_01957 [Sporomusaceae bacterium FL31]|nr:hypothetical protein SPFL3101_03591 [Sporomusaceae bacterium FL31]GCE34148.1 hypothetical protein SPFL3102_01957 [Sporomusaceae bacterium]
MSRFEVVFDEFIINRVIEVEEEKLNDPERIKLSLRHSKLYDEIMKLLPSEKQHLLSDFADNEVLISTLESKHNYDQGLKDGIKMKLFLELAN